MSDAHPDTLLELVARAQTFVLQTCRELMIAEHMQRLEIQALSHTGQPPIIVTMSPAGFVVLAGWWEGVVTRDQRSDFVTLTCDVVLGGVAVRLMAFHRADRDVDLTGLVLVSAPCPTCGVER